MEGLAKNIVARIPPIMRKKTAYRIFLPIGVVSLAWTLWCLRPILWGPRLTFPANVPLKAQHFIQEKYPTRKLTAGYLAELLFRPFEERMTPVHLKYRHAHWNGDPSDPADPGEHWTHFVHITDGMVFEFWDDNWEFKQTYECCGFP